MKHFLAYLVGILLVSVSFSAYGQKGDYIVEGKILDSAQHDPLVLATVYVKNTKDSSLIAYALTDENGGFQLTDVPRDKPVLFMVFYTGYKRYNRTLQNITTDTLKIDSVYLPMSANKLGEVTVIGEKPPIAIKGDTIEFNASSFHTRPNSVLAGLLKKLPGVDVDQDGNITANGKKVDKVTVDGKKFFGNDPKIALQNLPAAIVDKVQVIDTKTREEELTGEPAHGNTKTINVTLQKGKDHGVFGRVYAGYGTGEHYDASALINYFEGKRRISLLGATNNINQVGFTMNEMVDMMGGWGGGVRMLSYSNNGSFGINGIQFGSGGQGMKRSTSTGLNYNDDYGEHFSANASYFYGNTHLDNETQVARQNILPDSIFYYNSDNVTHNSSLSHRISGTISYKDSSWRIYYEPNINISHSEGTNLSSAISTGTKNQKINESNSHYTTDGENKHFSNRLSIYRGFKKKGQSFSMYLNADNNTHEGNNYNRYTNLFFDEITPDDSANQYINNVQERNQYRGQISYSQPVSKAIRINARYSFSLENSLTDKRTFDFNTATGKYGDLDTAFSNKFRSKTLTQTPNTGVSITLDSGRWTLNANMDFNFIGLHHYSFTHDAAFNQTQLFIAPDIYVSHNITKKGSIRLNYSAYIQQPDITQLLPVANNTNPLYIVKGNPNLKPTISRNLRLYYSSFDSKSGNNIWMSLSYNTRKNAIANVTSYDDQLRQLTTYTNVNGNDGLSLHVDLSKTKKKEDYHWQIKLGSSGGINNNHAFVNKTPYTSKAYNIRLHPAITYGYKERFEVTPSYQLYYQYSKYDIQSLNNRENIMNQAGFSGTLYWPERLTWTTDINYTHNSDVAPGFKKGYWLWNASIGLDIFKKKQATVELSVYDLLNQNISVRRSITDTYIEDRQTIILHRFFMLKLIYNLRKFGDKEKKDNNGPIFFF